MTALDGLASVLIGFLLASVASFLIRECRGLLVGEGVDPKTEREIRKVASDDPFVESVRRPLTMYLGPKNALLTLDVQFRSTASVADVAQSVDRIKSVIRNVFPDLKPKLRPLRLPTFRDAAAQEATGDAEEFTRLIRRLPPELSIVSIRLSHVDFRPFRS